MGERVSGEPCLFLPRSPGVETDVVQSAKCIHLGAVRAAEEKGGWRARGIGTLGPAGHVLRGLPELPQTKASDSQAAF